MRDSPYQQYVYSYPHKTAYRPLSPRPTLREVWDEQDRTRLFLYLHVPFCEMRCGFCNLFTRTGAPDELVGAYLTAVERQARAVGEALPDARFTAAAIGGGTPTYLSARELERMFGTLTDVMGARLPGLGLSVETSPATATPERLEVLARYGTSRISIGVQSFHDAEARAAGRPQRRAQVEQALSAINAAGLPGLNIDLIYGIDGQTEASWCSSIDAALAWQPQEMYLYPLYVRPLTGLGRRAHTRTDWDVQRLRLYEVGRERLLAAGYEQLSMRCFRRSAAGAGAGEGAGAGGAGDAGVPGAEAAGLDGDVEYACQLDGMVGLGCGARSYTSSLHYSFDYAVGTGQVRAILNAYMRMRSEDFGRVHVGFRLDGAEQRRRHLLVSLLQARGLDRDGYRARFGTDVADDFAAELAPLADAGWLVDDERRLVLTEQGLARSDAVGPALFSARTHALMGSYPAR